jgi:hypothetical protein
MFRVALLFHPLIACSSVSSVSKDIFVSGYFYPVHCAIFVVTAWEKGKESRGTDQHHGEGDLHLIMRTRIKEG